MKGTLGCNKESFIQMVPVAFMRGSSVRTKGELSFYLPIHCSGGSAPSYVYRLIGEMYNSDDRDL